MVLRINRLTGQLVTEGGVAVDPRTLKPLPDVELPDLTDAPPCRWCGIEHGFQSAYEAGLAKGREVGEESGFWRGVALAVISAFMAVAAVAAYLRSY